MMHWEIREIETGRTVATELDLGNAAEHIMVLDEMHPDTLKFVPTVSRPNEGRNATWEGRKDRVNAVAEEYLSTFNLPKNDTMVYACGHPGMIEEMKEKLPSQGWKFMEERFWKK